MEIISGIIEKITFRNEANAYTVALLKTKDEQIVVVGTLPFINEGDSVELEGEYTVHATYGEQFKVQSFTQKTPENSAAILRYLSSGAIKGVGPTTATRLVEKFGADTLDIIQNHPEDMANLKGISLNKAMQIHEEYKKQYGVRDIMLMLSKYNIAPDKCVAIYRKFGANAIEIIKANPYALCEEGIDFSFDLVEEIAADYQFDMNSELRVSAGIEYVLRKNLYNGHTCLPRDKFVGVASQLLAAKDYIVDECCQRLIDCFRLSSEIIDGREFLSIPEYHSAEEHIAARLCSVKRFMNAAVTVDELEIQNVENRLGIKFEDLQRRAIFEAFESGILVLTGGPGTGKTTTLNAIIKLFENRNLNIELAAPTGRAAKRMTELTGKDAKTIHRMLEVEWGENDKPFFNRNEKNPLECDVIIVDESSMIDTLLFDNLLKALRLSCRIILVGDSDQLPSIGAGNVLSDILAADIFPSIRLRKVFRQASKSMIINNAHAIINGEEAQFNTPDTDCFFMKRSDKYQAVDTVVSLITERLPNTYGVNPLTNIQVLCPSRMMETGTLNLNNVLQANLNPNSRDKHQMAYKGVYFREGDKVMQIKNNYDIMFKKDNGEYGSGVFNGDVGYITEIDIRANMLKVRFDDRVVTYFSEDLSQLELAYAITVHKSQGSEYDYVIIPLCEVPSRLVYRNLLYTAVTRAKKMLILVGDEGIWQAMVKNDKKTLRYTALQKFLKDNARETTF